MPGFEFRRRSRPNKVPAGLRLVGLLLLALRPIQFFQKLPDRFLVGLELQRSFKGLSGGLPLARVILGFSQRVEERHSLADELDGLSVGCGCLVVALLSEKSESENGISARVFWIPSCAKTRPF